MQKSLLVLSAKPSHGWIMTGRFTFKDLKSWWQGGWVAPPGWMMLLSVLVLVVTAPIWIPAGVIGAIVDAIRFRRYR